MSEWKWYHKSKYKTMGDIPEVSYRKLTAATFLILGIVCMLVFGALQVQWSFDKGVPVKQEYLTYINAADELHDPVVIIQTLERALVGIENLGLKPTDSGAAWSWDVNYHHTVAFNINQTETVIAYAENFIEWNKQSYSGTVVENVNDVYYLKLAHLENIVGNLATNTIEVAYCFDHNLFWTVYTISGIMLGLALAVIAVALATISD